MPYRKKALRALTLQGEDKDDMTNQNTLTPKEDTNLQLLCRN